MYEDKTLVCKDCGAEFIFTAGEQEFYDEKGFQNEPTRCKACRQARKASRAAGGPREMHDAICAECGKPTQVPFEPREDRPVYCSECFAARRGSSESRNEKSPVRGIFCYMFSKNGVPSSRQSTPSVNFSGVGTVSIYFRISSIRTLSRKVTREKLTPCLWARPVRPIRCR